MYKRQVVKYVVYALTAYLASAAVVLSLLNGTLVTDRNRPKQVGLNWHTLRTKENRYSCGCVEFHVVGGTDFVAAKRRFDDCVISTRL